MSWLEDLTSRFMSWMRLLHELYCPQKSINLEVTQYYSFDRQKLTMPIPFYIKIPPSDPSNHLHAIKVLSHCAAWLPEIESSIDQTDCEPGWVWYSSCQSPVSSPLSEVTRVRVSLHKRNVIFWGRVTLESPQPQQPQHDGPQHHYGLHQLDIRHPHRGENKKSILEI